MQDTESPNGSRTANLTCCVANRCSLHASHHTAHGSSTIKWHKSSRMGEPGNDKQQHNGGTGIVPGGVISGHSCDSDAGRSSAVTGLPGWTPHSVTHCVGSYATSALHAPVCLQIRMLARPHAKADTTTHIIAHSVAMTMHSGKTARRQRQQHCRERHMQP